MKDQEILINTTLDTKNAEIKRLREALEKIESYKIEGGEPSKGDLITLIQVMKSTARQVLSPQEKVVNCGQDEAMKRLLGLQQYEIQNLYITHKQDPSCPYCKPSKGKEDSR